MNLAAVALAAALLAPAPAPDCKSKAIGQPSHGRLECGRQLPVASVDYTTWDNALQRPLNRPWRRYGTQKLIRITERVAADYDARWGTRIVIGDLSRPHGGPFGPEFGGIGHASHQNGVDVDIYYPRRDRLELPPFTVREVDLTRAQWLVDRVDQDAKVAFIGPNVGLRRPSSRVEYLAHHDNHVHLRIRR
ncbi:MAG: penicillin-insensitive murein DD-endopeptidase [Thermoleophilaceae bacterium]|nr:penicillin-insensitive murein DD-endopeptidase [Thermoleophilaceae bacterium]